MQDSPKTFTVALSNYFTFSCVWCSVLMGHSRSIGVAYLLSLNGRPNREYLCCTFLALGAITSILYAIFAQAKAPNLAPAA